MASRTPGMVVLAFLVVSKTTGPHVFLDFISSIEVCSSVQCTDVAYRDAAAHGGRLSTVHLLFGWAAQGGRLSTVPRLFGSVALCVYI